MGGYIQIEINGKKVGLKFNMAAGESLATVKGAKSTYSNIVTIVWAGILGNAFVKQIDPEVTFEEVAEWVEDKSLSGDEEGELNKVSDAFLQSQPIQKLINTGKEDTKKKKQTGMK